MMINVSNNMNRGKSQGDLNPRELNATQKDNQNMVKEANDKRKAEQNTGMVIGDRTLRQQIWITCEYPTDSRIAKIWSILVMATILMSSASFVTQSLSEYYLEPPEAFNIVEILSVVIFTIEFVLRISTSPTPSPGTSWDYAKSRLVFLSKVMNLVDLLAILPFYIELIVAISNPEGGNSGASSLAVIRIIRIARVFRLLKLGKHNEGLEILVLTMKASWSFLVSVLFLVLILQVLFGSLIFFAETGSVCVQSFSCFGGDDDGRECTMLLIEKDGMPPYNESWSSTDLSTKTASGQPPTFNGSIAEALLPVNSFGNGSMCGRDSECRSVGNICFMEDGTVSLFNSIPITMWWALVTMCCVGFGDLRPTTTLGQFVGAVTALTGVIVLAMPTTVIGTNFSDIYERYYDEKDQEEKVEGLDGGGPAKVAPGTPNKGMLAGTPVKKNLGKKIGSGEIGFGILEESESPSKSFAGNKTRTEILNEEIVTMFENWSSDILRDTSTWDTLMKSARESSLEKLRETMARES